MKARLREELKATTAQKTARADVESDLVLLQQLLSWRLKGLTITAASAADLGALPSDGAY
jgi:hypothetical protein